MLDAAPMMAAPPEATPPASDLSRKKRWFRAWEDNKRDELIEQREARRYYHDKQWTDEEIARLKKRGQQPTVRNRIKRKIDFLVGVEQRLRRDPKASPRTPKHEHDADTATAALRYCCDKTNWEKVSSEVMHDGLVSGIGVCMVGVKNADPAITYVPIDRFFYDPRSVQPDFSDCKYMGLHVWMDVDEAKEQWPTYAGQLESMVDRSSDMGTAVTEQDRSVQWGDFEHRRVRIIEFWEKKAHPQHGMCWYYCFFTGDVILDAGWSTYLSEDGKPDCPYAAWTPYVDEKGLRYGIIRTMRSVQDEINYAASKYLHRLASDRVYFNRQSVEDVDEFRRQLARPDGAIEIMGEWGKDLGVIESGQKIQGEAERYQLAAAEIENMGPNPGLVGKGSGVDGASGRALLAQRDSGMTELSPVFERHRDWKLRVYRKVWARCRQTWQGEKWIRITDDDKSIQFVGLNQFEIGPNGALMVSNNIAEMDVDVILTEGPDTVTINEELMQVMANLGQAATSPVGKVMIELSNAPNKERLIKMLDEVNAPNPEVMAMQQRMAQLEEMLAAIKVDSARADLEGKRTDTLKKLVDIATPPKQEFDEFGNPTGMQQAPNVPAALAALQMFPLRFGEPLLAEQQPQPPQPQMDPMAQQPMGGEAQFQGDPMMGDPMAAQMPPEQLSQAGGLPISPDV